MTEGLMLSVNIPVEYTREASDGKGIVLDMPLEYAKGLAELLADAVYQREEPRTKLNLPSVGLGQGDWLGI